MSKSKQKSKSKPKSKSSSKNQHQKPQRGGLLTAAIILVGISGIVALIVALGENGFRTADLPTWFIAAAAAAAIADIVAAIGLWSWKRWAYYLYLASTLLSVGLGLVATGSLLFAFSRVIPFAIVGYIVTPKWAHFD